AGARRPARAPLRRRSAGPQGDLRAEQAAQSGGGMSGSRRRSAHDREGPWVMARLARNPVEHAGFPEMPKEWGAIVSAFDQARRDAVEKLEGMEEAAPPWVGRLSGRAS